jgi:hypothetical protein
MLQFEIKKQFYLAFSRKFQTFKLKQVYIHEVTIMTASVETKNVGHITQIIGPVIDAVFSPGQMPNIYNALVVQGTNEAGQKLLLP